MPVNQKILWLGEGRDSEQPAAKEKDDIIAGRVLVLKSLFA